MIHSPPKATVVDRAITAIRVNVNFVMVDVLLYGPRMSSNFLDYHNSRDCGGQLSTEKDTFSWEITGGNNGDAPYFVESRYNTYTFRKQGLSPVSPPSQPHWE
jgi:hypothetical protein